jgi:hypothetical protein
MADRRRPAPDLRRSVGQVVDSPLERLDVTADTLTQAAVVLGISVAASREAG